MCQSCCFEVGCHPFLKKISRRFEQAHFTRDKRIRLVGTCRKVPLVLFLYHLMLSKLEKSAWDFFGVSCQSRDFYWFSQKPQGFFTPIRSSPSIEIQTVPPWNQDKPFQKKQIFLGQISCKQKQLGKNQGQRWQILYLSRICKERNLGRSVTRIQGWQKPNNRSEQRP